MKLSFSLSSSKQSKQPQLKQPQPQPQTQQPSSPSSSSPNKEFVTEFDPSKTLIDPNSKTHVIAPIANSWRQNKKSKTLDLPDKSDDPNIQFETVNTSIDPVDTGISYGLNLRQKPNSDTKPVPEPGRVDPGSEPGRVGSIDELMLNKLRNDLDNLPEDRGFEEYDEMPVEDFAKALLKGYGWREGQGVGKNAKEDVKVFEFKLRTGKEGLGFVNDLPAPPTNNRTDNRTDTKTENRGVKINKEKEKVVSRSKDYDRKTGSKRGREREYTNDKRTNTSTSTRTKSWLASRIRVRIISKELKGGRLYLQKGEVVDVVGPTSCDVSMDNSREIIQNVDQEFLETALPRRGGPVLVLYGRYKGVYGSLEEKDVENETAVVKDADTHELLNVKLEQIAEFVGDPEDIGY